MSSGCLILTQAAGKKGKEKKKRMVGEPIAVRLRHVVTSPERGRGLKEEQPLSTRALFGDQDRVKQVKP